MRVRAEEDDQGRKAHSDETECGRLAERNAWRPDSQEHEGKAFDEETSPDGATNRQVPFATGSGRFSREQHAE
jgi:hypothetical protein